MTRSISRQQRKQALKEALKSGIAPQVKPVQIPNTSEPKNLNIDVKFSSIIQDLNKVLNYSRFIENKLNVLNETIFRKGILISSDITETESLYLKKEESKKQKIKDLLSEDNTAIEYIRQVIEDPNLPGYMKFGINPVKDLNMNPFEVGNVLKEMYPNETVEKYLDFGKKWDLTHEHFGFKKPE